ncbi:MAG TPA: hypothetical protein VGI81_14770 [Tepidisphaeraceae bacterium]|jgi:hypothetical protein
MKRLALGLFLAFGVPLAPGLLSAQVAGEADASSPAPANNSQDLDLQQIDAAIEADRSGLAQSRQDGEEIRAVIRDDEAQSAVIRKRLAGGEADLPRIQADLARAGAALDAGRASFEPIQARYNAARAKLEAARNDARTTFEAGPEFRAAADAASSAANARQTAEDRAGQRLLQTDAARRKQAEIDKWTARVAFFDQAGPAFERDRLAAASRVQDARWELSELKTRYLDTDSDVHAARDRASAADAAVARLRADNESRLATVPAVDAATQALAAEQGPYLAGLAVVRHAEARVAAIRGAYDGTMNGMAADRQTLASIDDELAHARADLTQVNADIDRLTLDLSNALAAADQARAQQAQAAADADSTAMAQPVLSWADTAGLLPRVRLFPAATYCSRSRVEPQTIVVNNWIPQPIFIEPSYFFVVGQSQGHDGRHHGDHHDHPRPQQSNHGADPRSAGAVAVHRWEELQANRTALRSREVGALEAHGIIASPAAAGMAIPAASAIRAQHTGLRSPNGPAMGAGSAPTYMTLQADPTRGGTSPAAPFAPGGVGFHLGWAPSANGNAAAAPSPAGGASSGGFASPPPTPAPSQAAGPAQPRPSARPRR